MTSTANIKQEFIRKRDKLFHEHLKQMDALRFSMEYSLLVEEHIRTLSGSKKYNFVLASAGSFSRRELSPFSDIDIIFITESADECLPEIAKLVTKLWDNGLEASHTVREFTDIKKYLDEDLHTFTQFFETRFLLGTEKIYKEWNNILFSLMKEDVKAKLVNELSSDILLRYDKFGDSPKVLEPNVKSTAGGLRDFQTIEWIYVIINGVLLNKQAEITQAESFINLLRENNYTTPNECKRLLDSYKLIMTVRNLLHLISNQKNDRFEFGAQKKISGMYYHQKDSLALFMREYFTAANVINRFSKSMIKKFQEEISNPFPDSLAIELDDDFVLKGKTISLSGKGELSISDILRAFYYRGFYSAHFDESLRSAIVENVENYDGLNGIEMESSTFFREILRLPKNVGQTLSVMNELGVLKAFMPEFGDLIGFLQHGVYHCYTADEHTLMTIQNLEKLEKDPSPLGKIYNSMKDREILHLGLLFHDIAKPVNIAGHEIIGAEMAASIMNRLGYSEEEIDRVTFLVKSHLVMEQIAFRRNLNDPETLNNFTSRFDTIEKLELLYLVTYADLSAVNNAVWTSWKSDLLAELYKKSRAMIEEQISGEELLISSVYVVPKEISKHSKLISEANVKEHIQSIDDLGYAHQFSEKEIARHVEEIQKGVTLSALFKEFNTFTNITIITKDFPSLLSKLCGVLSINDANIHDAKIFTRKDGIVIDTFNVTDFRTNEKIEKERYAKIESDLKSVISGLIQLNQEFARMKTKWWRIESKFFKRSGKIKVEFDKHKKYTIIDIISPDRLGFLYQVTSKMSELGLIIYLAKISTRGDDIVDSFYVLDRNGNKISQSDYDFIKSELTGTITLML
ncbi:MAG TPA: HD domain-containing protein [Ignavibacteriaceae bacterium]|nr:HD domain-containing protein [Ignavibacteriaceae bacterium]